MHPSLNRAAPFSKPGENEAVGEDPRHRVVVSGERRSEIRAVVERVKVENPENRKAHNYSDESQVRFARTCSLSDRVRNYWPNVEISKGLTRLIENLRESPPPLPLAEQYLPRQASAIRAGAIHNNPVAIIHHKVREPLARYADACGFVLGG
jgi:D-tagatose-1,6-bisphosphate aldolase subunit GatZ/KbaZ